MATARKTIRIETRPFQEPLNRGLCGPSSLKIVLDYYGVRASLSGLAKLCATSPELGTDARGIKHAATILGFTATSKDRSSFRDVDRWLRKGVPVIVDWMTSGRPSASSQQLPDGHYSVVTGLTPREIILNDPEIGGFRRITRSDFERVWFDFRGSQISGCDDLILRQIIAITPRPKHRKTGTRSRGAFSRR